MKDWCILRFEIDITFPRSKLTLFDTKKSRSYQKPTMIYEENFQFPLRIVVVGQQSPPAELPHDVKSY